MTRPDIFTNDLCQGYARDPHVLLYLKAESVLLDDVPVRLCSYCRADAERAGRIKRPPATAPAPNTVTIAHGGHS
jgi:hypothetical protein